MDKKYWLDVPELDAQHEEIEGAVASLGEATGSHDKWHLIHYILVRLHELLRIHFTVEESVMRVVGYQDIDNHKKTHKELLDKVVQFKNDSLLGKGFFDINEQEQQLFLTHILDHDMPFATFLKAQSIVLPR